MSLIIYGPQGCGKTRLAQYLARHYGCNHVADDWTPGDALGVDTLALTHIPSAGATSFLDAVVDMVTNPRKTRDELDFISRATTPTRAPAAAKETKRPRAKAAR